MVLSNRIKSIIFLFILLLSFLAWKYYVGKEFEKRNLDRSWSGFENAAYEGRIEDLKLYIKDGYGPSYISLYWLLSRNYILMQIVSKGQCEVLKFLIESGLRSLDIREPNGDRPLIIVAATTDNALCVKVLLEAGVDPNSPGVGYLVGGEGSSITPLYEAVFINYISDRNKNPERIETVRLLLEYGADANIIHPFDRDNTLYFPAFDGNILVLEMLLKHGANPNQIDRYGNVPLFSAIRGKSENRYNAVKLLIENGANINYTNLYGSGLHIATELGDEKMVKLLLQLGIDRKLKSEKGLRAIDYARKKSIRNLLRN
jgi:ankyrin repeat protein